MNAPSKNIHVKVAQIGNSLGLILPREAVAALNVAKGDTLYLTEAPGGYRLTTNDPEFDRRMTLAKSIMKKRRNVLRELAK